MPFFALSSPHTPSREKKSNQRVGQTEIKKTLRHSAAIARNANGAKKKRNTKDRSHAPPSWLHAHLNIGMVLLTFSFFSFFLFTFDSLNFGFFLLQLLSQSAKSTNLPVRKCSNASFFLSTAPFRTALPIAVRFDAPEIVFFHWTNLLFFNTKTQNLICTKNTKNKTKTKKQKKQQQKQLDCRKSTIIPEFRHQ